MKLEQANKNDALAINALLNRAYRGEKGWSTEIALVDGERSQVSDVEAAIEQGIFLIYKEKGELIGCICIESKGDNAYLGQFAVHPDHQERGLGNLLLKSAEAYAKETLKPQQFILSVLSKRFELIAFYERRGYQKSGVSMPFPRHLNVGVPKIDDLIIEQFCKNT